MEMNVKDNRIFRVTTDINTHNRGTLCVGGRFGYDLVQHPHRLTTPLLREKGFLRPASWEEAIGFVSDRLKAIVKESGPDSVAGLASPRLTNEDCYAFQKFFRTVIGTNNIDSEARFGYLRVQRAFELTTGISGSAGTLEELLETSAVLIIGIDPIEETPALGWKIKAAARKYDSNIVVANARATNLDRFARLRLRIRPYTEGDLLLGLMKIILDSELWDRKFVRDHTTNFLPMKKLLDKISLKGILKRTGVASEDLEEAARVLAEAPNAAIIFGGDVILQANGPQCVMNLANLALLTGNMGRPNAGIYPIVEKGNILGLCDMGVMPEYLPGYQDAAAVRDLFERVWKAPLPYGRGKTAPEMATALESGELRAAYLVGADPVTDYPHAGRFAAAFEKAELIVVHDIFPGPAARMAHCVLPAASFAEKEGTMTNIEHRVQKLNPVLPPVGNSMPDWSILEEVAKAMGRPMGYFTVSDVFREMTSTIPFYQGIKMHDLPGDGTIVRPYAKNPARQRSDRSYSFAPVRVMEGPELASAADFPFEMIAGRSMYHFGSLTTRSENLLTLCPEGYVEINAQDAHELGVKDLQRIEVRSRVSSFVAPVKVSGKIERGLVFVPTNFPNLGVYKLFEENTTVCRVKLTPLDERQTS